MYGALVGLGFQITEDMFYFFTHFIGPAQGANEIGALIQGYWIRVISSGLYSHPLYAGLGGMGLAYWATRLDQPLQRRRLFLVGGLALGIGLHVFWNMPALNFLLGDGRHLYARCGTRLCYIVRKAPFGAAVLADDYVRIDFSTVTTPRDRVAVICTAPLTTNEIWTHGKPGELWVFDGGQLRATLPSVRTARTLQVAQRKSPCR